MRPAGFWIRLFATIIDSAIFTIILTPLLSLIYFGSFDGYIDYYYTDYFSDDIDSTENIAFDTAELLIRALVVIALWVLWSGKTPGKALLGIQIIKLDDSPMGWKEAIIRYIGYILNVITLFIGFLMIAARRDKRGLHDLIAKTKVVHRN